mgnify:CR=1 FL=1|jgi:hypothetical protein
MHLKVLRVAIFSYLMSFFDQFEEIQMDNSKVVEDKGHYFMATRSFIQ